MNNLQTHKCLGVDARNNCDHMPEATWDTPPSYFSLASKVSLIIFIGLCGPVELLLNIPMSPI